MLDAYIPEGALSPAAQDKLLARLTDLLLQHEGVDPANRAARARAWVFVHRPAVDRGEPLLATYRPVSRTCPGTWHGR